MGKWTETDEKLLREHYQLTSGSGFAVSTISKILNRSCSSITNKAGKLGLTDIVQHHRYAASYGQANPSWVGDALDNKEAGRKRARRQFRDMGTCERCDKLATDRHHIDGNPFNNRRSNISFLCRKCHMKLDGRLAALIEAGAMKPPQSVKFCHICGTPANPLRHGKCGRCYDYHHRSGVERDPNKSLPRYWSDKEDNRLRKEYPSKHNWRSVAVMLNRTENSVKLRASRLGITARKLKNGIPQD